MRAEDEEGLDVGGNIWPKVGNKGLVGAKTFGLEEAASASAASAAALSFFTKLSKAGEPVTPSSPLPLLAPKENKDADVDVEVDDAEEKLKLKVGGGKGGAV